MTFIVQSETLFNLIVGVMVSMLPWSAVDCGSKHWLGQDCGSKHRLGQDCGSKHRLGQDCGSKHRLGQTKDYEIGIYCFCYYAA